MSPDHSFHRGPIRVLVVGDSSKDADDLRASLGEGFEVTWEHAYSRAREAMVGDTHDVYLLHRTFGEDGSEGGVALLRDALASGCTRPTVLATDQADGFFEAVAMQAGATDVVTLDDTPAAILKRILGFAVERSNTWKVLRETQARYDLAMRGSKDGLWDWNMASDSIYLSPRLLELLGYASKELEPKPESWIGLVHPDDRTKMAQALADHLDGRVPQFMSEHRVRHKDGTYRWVLVRGVASRTQDGVVDRIAGSQTDVTERRRAEERAIYRSLHDSLTGLPNRSLLIDRADQAIARHRRESGYRYAILFLDLDRFRIINDTLGHNIGDALLRQAAKRMSAHLRPVDTVARLGGDEFCVLLNGMESDDDAIVAARKLQKALESPFVIRDREFSMSVSIGITTCSRGYTSVDDLMRDADTAMHQAKAKGRSCYVVFDEEMRAGVVRLFDIETEIRNGVKNGEFEVYYQPIVDMRSRNTEGFEALLRWRSPRRGLVSPLDFIPIAEDSGLIVELGTWVLSQACNQIKVWRKASNLPLYVSVNVSARQFRRRDFVHIVRSVLNSSGLDPSMLHLELTESVLVEDLEGSVPTIERIRAMGAHVDLDDFGTGYSSLSYLAELPVSSLKIDRSFVRELVNKERPMKIVRGIISLAQSLEMPVTAEGVEDHQQLISLAELGCDRAQGYLFSPPVTTAEVEAQLAGWSSGAYPVAE